MRAERPLIGVTGPDAGGHTAWWFTRLAICRAGGRAVRLSPDRPGPPDLHGLLLGGGADIDPAIYGGQPDIHGSLDKARDRFEQSLLGNALARGLPVLGICRGTQLLNAVLGGNLHQDLRPLRHKTTNRHTAFAVRPITIASGSHLHGVLGLSRCLVNSLNHQGINRPGLGLRVVAENPDNLVQAVEDEGPDFVIGVQWHPEYMPHHPRQQRLFRALVAEARRRREGTPDS